MNDIHHHLILIIDFGSQYTMLIARRIRELGVYCEIYPHNLSIEKINKLSPKAIILSGGPDTATAHNSPQITTQIFTLGVPILGICYGMQIMAKQLGGEVKQALSCEFGHTRIKFANNSKLFNSINSQELSVWMSHGDQVAKMPIGFFLMASTKNCPIVAMADQKRHFYGLQFHPEVTHTEHGMQILENFIKIAKCERYWQSDRIIETLITNIIQKTANKRVILGLSGGVDSSVVAILLHKAIGKKLICIFVDNGLLRLNEAEQIINFWSKMGMQIIHVKAQSQFLTQLKGIEDPETKRKIIGNTFIKIFEKEALNLPNIGFLAQGTIYPDVIESAMQHNAHVIKSHHNVGGLPDELKLPLLEPLRELFKDEVRKIGLNLGLPEQIIKRHPFPGPGLGVRIIGEINNLRINILQKADAIFMEELQNFGWYHKVNQAFATFIPVKTVGVVGDTRRYAYIIGLRAVATVDFMTAKWVHLPYELLEKVSERIINEISQVSRVVYDISSKPPATIEWE